MYTQKVEDKIIAYDFSLGDRIKENLKGRRGITERKMFDGLSFLLKGKMVCGVIKNKLVARVNPKHYKELLTMPHTSIMDFNGKPLTGFIYVNKQGLKTDKSLQFWIDQGLSYAKSLVKKEKKK